MFQYSLIIQTLFSNVIIKHNLANTLKLGIVEWFTLPQARE